MPPDPLHLFVDISGHGYGHLAIAAPVLNVLAQHCPGLRLTVRSALPEAKLRERIAPPFAHIPAASDFGFAMIDANRVDLPASGRAYREFHADWPARLAAECAWLAELRPDRVLTCVSYLPLAAARRLGIPGFGLCSLNWADLVAHFFAGEAWMPAIHAEITAAYAGATAFLRITPGMPMCGLGNVRSVGMVARLGQRRPLSDAPVRHVLVGLGGIPTDLPLRDWPVHPGLRWVAPAAWAGARPDCLVQESLGRQFTDLLASVDAVVTKPGYGTFTEAALNGVPVLYVRRDDWPEQDCLIDWLRANGRCAEISAGDLRTGNLSAALADVWRQAPPPLPVNDGAAAVVRHILAG